MLPKLSYFNNRLHRAARANVKKKPGDLWRHLESTAKMAVDAPAVIFPNENVAVPNQKIIVPKWNIIVPKEYTIVPNRNNAR